MLPGVPGFCRQKCIPKTANAEGTTTRMVPLYAGEKATTRAGSVNIQNLTDTIAAANRVSPATSRLYDLLPFMVVLARPHGRSCEEPRAGSGLRQQSWRAPIQLSGLVHPRIPV